MDNSKIILGTVQSGMDYGISNTQGATSFDETKKIFNLAKKKDISFLDTSINYGKSETIIGDLNDFNFNIITK